MNKIWWAVAILLGVLLGLAILGGGCATWNRINPIDPNYRPLQECNSPTGYMLRAPGRMNDALQDCYDCELAHRCFDEGNHYCCEGPMCSECQKSPFRNVKQTDAGVQ